MFNIYKKLKTEQGYFHTGFLYGFICFAIASNIIQNNDLGIVIGFLLGDQIIYRILTIKRTKK